MGALQESLDFYNHALKVNYYSTDLYFNLGILLLDLNKHKEASDIIEQTLLSQIIMLYYRIHAYEEENS